MREVAREPFTELSRLLVLLQSPRYPHTDGSSHPDCSLLGNSKVHPRQSGEQVGELHMVSVRPGHRGKRLGHVVTCAVLHRLKEIGCGPTTAWCCSRSKISCRAPPPRTLPAAHDSDDA